MQAVDQVAHMVGDIPEMQVLPAPVAGIKDLPQVRQDVDDLAIAGQGGVAQVMNRAALFVRLDDPPRDLRERLFQIALS